MVDVKLKVKIAGRCNANEVFLAVTGACREAGSEVTKAIIEDYQEGIVGVLCSASGRQAKKGLGGHEKKGEPGKRCPCRTFRRAGYWSRPKQLRGDEFEVSFLPAMVECATCGKRLSPILDALELDPYQRRTDELLKKTTEAVADTSYRRGSHQLEVLGVAPVPKSTAHQWVAELEVPVSEGHGEPFLFADGTGFKRQPGERGEVRLVLEMAENGQIRPLGVWAGTSWEDIGKEVKERLDGQPQLFIGDGEIAMEKWLGGLAKDKQRCDWHLARDSGVMLWHDGAPKGERDSTRQKLSRLLAIEIPEKDIEMVSEADREKLLERIKNAEKEILELRQQFMQKGYSKAATYLENARKHLFTHLNLWIETGIVAPRTSSIIENIIRELVRRLKKVGWNWKDEGASRMGRLVMIRRYDPDEWRDYWRKRMNLQGRCTIELICCEAKRVA